MVQEDISEKDTEWWVSCKRFTCWVKTAGQHGTKIVDAAPIMKKFIGMNFIRICAQLGIERKEKLNVE